MTTSDQPAEAGRQSFIEVAQREMVAFENKEREFQKRVKEEDLARLGLASLQTTELH